VAEKPRMWERRINPAIGHLTISNVTEEDAGAVVRAPLRLDAAGLERAIRDRELYLVDDNGKLLLDHELEHDTWGAPHPKAAVAGPRPEPPDSTLTRLSRSRQRIAASAREVEVERRRRLEPGKSGQRADRETKREPLLLREFE
jgi:hypothetical protein